jgi:homoserine kinase type II
MPSQAEKTDKYSQTLIETQKVINANYGFSARKVSRIKDGMINTSFAVDLGGGNKVLFRVYKNNNKKLSDIKKELTTSTKLIRAGIPVPRVLDNRNGDSVTRFTLLNKEWKAVMFEFLPGRHIEPTDKSLIRQVSMIQGDIHLTLKQNDPVAVAAFMKGLQKLIHIERDAAILKLGIKFASMGESIKSISKEMDIEFEKSLPKIQKLPHGLCHLDYDSSNILTYKNKITGVIDFDDMETAPFIADVAFSLWWWTFFNRQKESVMAEYLSGYKLVRAISVEELSFLKIFLRARNLFLLCLLFVNGAETPNQTDIQKGLAYDRWIKRINLN